MLGMMLIQIVLYVVEVVVGLSSLFGVDGNVKVPDDGSDTWWNFICFVRIVVSIKRNTKNVMEYRRNTLRYYLTYCETNILGTFLLESSDYAEMQFQPFSRKKKSRVNV